MGLDKYKFHLFDCGFTNFRTQPRIPISLITVVLEGMNDYAVAYLEMVKTLGFDTEDEYVGSYPGNMQRDTEICKRGGITVDVNTPTLLTKVLNANAYKFGSRGDNDCIKRKLIKDFEDGNLQLISTPKMSGVTLCTGFKTIKYDDLWYCSDWGG